MKQRTALTLFVVTLGFAVFAPATYAIPTPGRFLTGTGYVHDTVAGLYWQADGTTVATQSAAQSYCMTLDVPGIGTGWRLPNVRELSSLIDPAASPLIDPTAFPAPLAMTGYTATYWSSTPYADDPMRFWTVSFTSGNTLPLDGSTQLGVRCVR